MIRIPLLVLTLTLWCLPTVGQASTIIFQRELKFNTNVNNFDTNQLDFKLVFSDSLINPTNAVTLYDDLIIEPDDEGMVGFESTALTDPAFSTVVGRLQDSLDENIRYIVTEDELGGLSEKRGGSESNFFLFGDPTNAPQLAEATIDKFLLRVDQFPFIVSGAVPAEGVEAVVEPLEIVLELTIFGTLVPEPTTGWLFASGIVTLGLSLFSRQRRLLRATVAGPR